MTEVSLTDTEFVKEVRAAMAGLNSDKIPEDTILQAKKRFVLPLLNEVTGNNPDQENFDNAAIAWTAEKSFDAWLTFTRIRDEGIEAYVNPEEYRSRLQSRTNTALSIMGTTRPPEIPHTVVTVTFDDKIEKVTLRD